MQKYIGLYLLTDVCSHAVIVYCDFLRLYQTIRLLQTIRLH